MRYERPDAGGSWSGGEAVYDVVIVGTGPAGIFTALELSRLAPGLRVLMLEKGPDLEQRACPMQQRRTTCARCQPCSVLSGWGGAGAFSDGKLTLTADFGGNLEKHIGRELTTQLVEYVDEVYLKFGASAASYGTEPEVVRRITRQAATAGISFVPAKIRHLGTDKCPQILLQMRQFLEGQVEVRLRTTAARVLAREGRVTGVVTQQGEEIPARAVVLAPGREGSEWMAAQAHELGLRLATNPVDIGVRVEVPAVVMEPITEGVYESKLIYYTGSFDDQVRTFCVCPYGEVVMENNRGLITVNGHSYHSHRTEYTNFALLVSKTFTEPFQEPILYGRYVASLANLLGGTVLVQRLGDLLSGRRSTEKRMAKGMVQPTLREAVPGDLSLVLPYRHLIDILEMLEALDKMAPGVHSRHTLLYGVEVKFYSSRVEVDSDLQTRVKGLYVAGDGAGITRGLAQASASGVHVARSLVRNGWER
ncbi:MAG TPA: NAD(P)/FAD-dependent oxidoreductase [Firmicutes bacterium]|nr:NAD(P)/FAD-dependent oxidoreductase [Bacillota bacterium]